MIQYSIEIKRDAHVKNILSKNISSDCICICICFAYVQFIIKVVYVNKPVKL